MAEPSSFDLFGRTPPRVGPTSNSHSRMMEARPGKQTGLRTRRGCKMNLTKRTELRRGPTLRFLKGAIPRSSPACDFSRPARALCPCLRADDAFLEQKKISAD